jgi:hypothetical protein
MCIYTYQRTADVETYGLSGMRNVESDFYNRASRKNIKIPPPVLNISAYQSAFVGGDSSGALNTTWVRANSNDTINEAYIKDNGKCQNTGVGCLQILDKF